MNGYRIYAKTGTAAVLIGETLLNHIARAIVSAARRAPPEYGFGEVAVWLDGRPVDISDWAEPAVATGTIDWGNRATVIPGGI